MGTAPILKLEHADSRGEIYSITLPDGRELMLHHSNPGALRGGHSHNVDEIVVLLSGKMRYTSKIASSADHIVELKAPFTRYNQADLVHMAEFLEDSWLVEYKLGTGAITHDYEPYRAKVRASILR